MRGKQLQRRKKWSFTIFIQTRIDEDISFLFTKILCPYSSCESCQHLFGNSSKVEDSEQKKDP
ncbi:hypothetical protein BD408DRAFT_466257 [Parasitella parasitica]|nr:hypothetical protein BD408DRAFT_466257 [Parasitella parasitica]